MTLDICPKCGSANIDHDFIDYDVPGGGDWSVWACEDCGYQLSSENINELDLDDDFSVTEAEIVDTGLMRHIERYSMYGRQPNDQN